MSNSKSLATGIATHARQARKRIVSSVTIERLEGRTLLTSASYDAVAQWNPAANSKTTLWQYEYSATLAGAITPYAVHGSKTTPPTYNFWGETATPRTSAGVYKNTSGGTINFAGDLGDPNHIIWPSNELLLACGNAGQKDQFSHVRWLAPANGTFNIKGAFTDLQRAHVTVDVLDNGKIAFASSFSGTSGHQGSKSFSLSNVKVNKGDVIDFVVGTVAANSDCPTGLAAVISAVQPTVSVTATDPSASVPAVGPVTSGSFTITRSAVGTATTITALLGGSAVYKTDYTLQVFGATSFTVNTTTHLLSLNVGAGSGPIVIEVIPVVHANERTNNGVTLTLQPGVYVPVSNFSSAVVTINPVTLIVRG